MAGVVFLLYVLWGPILQAGQRNATAALPSSSPVRGSGGCDHPRARRERHEQADSRGRLELVENRRTWMLLELEDEEGYLGRVAFPMEKKHQSIRRGSLIRCLVLSERKDFSKIGPSAMPGCRACGCGLEYPFLLRPPLRSFANSA